jgi:hypothetical protein
MANSYGPKGIVTDGIVFSADAGNTQCYTSGSVTATDIVGGKTLTLENGSGTVIQPFPNSWGLDGTDDYINVGDDPIDLTNDFTISAWINKVDNSGGDDDRIYAQIQDAENYFQLITDNATQKFAVKLEVGNVVKINSLTYGSITFDTWLYLSFTWDGTNGKFYKNGVEISTDGSTSSSAGSTFQTNIGRRPDGFSTTYYEGKIGPMITYNKALTASEIKQNYNSQKARFGL